MKDFYDVHQLASLLTFGGSGIVRAIRATFERRRTPLPEEAPAVLSSSFLDDVDRSTQWRALLRRSRLDGPASATQLAADLRDFLLEPLSAAARGVDFDAVWPPGGPWAPNRKRVKGTSV